MVTEERMRDLFIRANPIPDLDVIKVDTATHLDILEKRSSGMTQIDTPSQPETAVKRKLTLAMAGGLIATLAFVVALAMLTNENANEATGEVGLVSADFVGTWTVPIEGISSLFMYLDEEGRYALSDSFGSFEERTLETGTWTFDGEELVLVTDGDVETNCANTVGRYSAQRVEDDRIRLTPATPDQCPDRQDGIALGPWRAYPIDPELSEDSAG